MKTAIITLFLLTGSVSGAAAQSAADPNAIDFSAKMDTLRSGYGFFDNITGNLNVQKKNSDSWEDFEIGYNPGINEGLLRFGGPFLFDSLNNPQISGDPIQYGDFDGDGIGDIIDHDLVVHKGLKAYPYFDSVGGPYIRIKNGSPGSINPIGATNFYSATSVDFLALATIPDTSYTFHEILELYTGGKRFDSSATIYPDEMLDLGVHSTGYGGTALASFVPNEKPMIVTTIEDSIDGKSIKKTGIVRHHSNLSTDTIVWISNSTLGPNEIVATNMYATDITGDGIPDLLVSDGDHVYIFKGGGDFGTYELTKDRAYYTIPNPRLIDRSGRFLDVSNFGGYMHALGDLSGSGIPYIMIEASLNINSGVSREYGMIYAGGKALDSLYDGIIIFPDAWSLTLDTLHSIDSNGRSAVAIVHNHDADIGFGDADMLLYRDGDKLPHTTNPNLSVAYASPSDAQLELSAFPSIAQRYVKVHIVSPRAEAGLLNIYDLLGRAVLSRKIEIDPGKNIEYFETSGLVNGTYIVRLNNSTACAKFIVKR